MIRSAWYVAKIVTNVRGGAIRHGVVITHAKNEMATTKHITGFCVLNKNHPSRTDFLSC